MEFSPVRVIEKKRNHQKLNFMEIHNFIQGLTQGSIPEYQVTALLMAIYLNGMDAQETADLTKAMVESGKKLNFKTIPGDKVDKHSTGGIGDKVSLILAPLAAACGLIVPMMAGRGLGFSGGTLDKLESIPGFQVGLNEKQMAEILKKIGCVIVGQTHEVAPADQKLYSLRDVTATVESIPLIVGSILSKKIAEGAENLLMDIKVGSGAFMKTQKEAETLAQALSQVGKKSGLHVHSVLTNMNQPLGYAAGNALEVLECLEILQNKNSLDPTLKSHDLKELTLKLCAHMLHLAKKSMPLSKAYALSKKTLESGAAWKKFKEMIQLQNGNLELFINAPTFARNQTTLTSQKSGYLHSFLLSEIGYLIVDLGGGRKKSSDLIDPLVGIHFHKKIGDPVKKNDPLCTVFWNQHLPAFKERLYSSILISPRKPKPQKLIYKFIR